MSVSEIAEYLGIGKEKVKYSIGKLIKEGRLEGKTAEEKKKELDERVEKVYEAVKAGNGTNTAKHLGMKYTDVQYALKKLEEEGRIRKEGKCWVAA